MAGVIMLPSLGRYPFWQDEAETALLAKSIVKNGLPYVWDGKNIITQLNGNESTAGGLWTFTPWLPFYITAGSFKLFGESTFAGRLPFVLIALLSLIPVYLLALKITNSRHTAIISTVFLALNMQFILYSRQCKYYSIFFLLVPLAMLFLTEIEKSRKKAMLFSLCLILIFHANYVAAFTLICGILFYAAVSNNKSLFKRLVLIGIAIIPFTIPFLFLSDIGASAASITSSPTFKSYFEKLFRHIWYFNNMVFPVILFIPFYFSKTLRQSSNMLLTVILGAWLALPLTNQDVFRYNLGLIPLFSIMLSLIIYSIWRKNKTFAVFAALILLSTNILNYSPWIISKIALKTADYKFVKFIKFDSSEKTKRYLLNLDSEISGLSFKSIITHDVLKSEYAAYLNDIRGKYDEPLAAVIKFLSENASDDDIVAINFDQLSLAYYLDLKIANMLDKEKLAVSKKFALPDYIFRHSDADWYIEHPASLLQGPAVNKSDVLKSGGEMFDTGINTLYWDGNWPQKFRNYANKYLFKEEASNETVKIYKLNSSK